MLNDRSKSRSTSKVMFGTRLCELNQLFNVCTLQQNVVHSTSSTNEVHCPKTSICYYLFKIDLSQGKKNISLLIRYSRYIGFVGRMGDVREVGRIEIEGNGEDRN